MSPIFAPPPHLAATPPAPSATADARPVGLRTALCPQTFLAGSAAAYRAVTPRSRSTASFAFCSVLHATPKRPKPRRRRPSVPPRTRPRTLRLRSRYEGMLLFNTARSSRTTHLERPRAGAGCGLTRAPDHLACRATSLAVLRGCAHFMGMCLPLCQTPALPGRGLMSDIGGWTNAAPAYCVVQERVPAAFADGTIPPPRPPPPPPAPLR